MTRASVLVADDDAALLEMMRLTLDKEGFAVTAAASAEEVSRLIQERRFDLVVSDIYLGDGSAMDLLSLFSQERVGKVILVTAQGTVETVAEAQRAGVFDYLAKPFAIETLVSRVEAALGKRSSKPQRQVAVGPESMIVGSDPAIVEVYKAVSRVAPLQVPVLLRGETGTGKELVARALHRFGARPQGPWVAVNCGAIPENLLESELFGHRKGAFTGAVRDQPGTLQSAHGGTVLLDEIGELPALLQVKLLRFLQEGEIHPVGGDRGVRVDVRVIAATHRDLRRETEEGRFREDLFYRLAAYEIVLPPLRRRLGDLPALVEHFRRRYAEQFGLVDAPAVSPAVLHLLEEQPWPGNVRQLENLVQRALIDLGGLGDTDEVRHLLGDQQGRIEEAPAIGDDLTLEELERLHIEAVLRRYRGNRSRSAQALGIERKSLYRKAQRLGIRLDAEEEDAP